jgi:D-xylose 1-dehydrogenase (NADP+, D-xylono-1,5-lactone-forming)
MTKVTEQLNWGILGCARIAERALIPALREARNARLFGIAARDKARAREWAGRFAIQNAYPDYRSLLDDPTIDAVYIPLPNHLHAEWTIRAAQAGKHVLCEKPLALTEDEVRAMYRRANEAGVLLMEGFMYRFHPQFERLMGMLRMGEIGELRSLRSTFSFTYLGDEANYRWDKAMGGGALYDVGCYPVSAARTVFGAEPLSVSALSRVHAKTGVDLATSLLLEFPNDRQAILDCAFDIPFQSRLEVAGARGRISLERAFSAKNFDVEIRIFRENDPEIILVPAVNQYTRMIEHFGEAARGLCPPSYGEMDALGNARTIDATFQSVRTKRPVMIP